MKRATTTLILPFLFLAACGGGNSGDYGADGGNNPPPAGFTITAANGLLVSQVAFEAALSAGDMAGLAGGAAPTGNSDGGLANAATGQFSKAAAGFVAQEAIVGPTVLECAAGGTVTVTMDLADPTALVLAGALTAGDTILNEYAACNEGFGETSNGTVDADVDAFTGDILVGVYDLTMTMDLIDFQVTTAEDVITANGDGTAVLNSLATPYIEASVSGSTMTTDTNSSSETLTSFSSAQTLDGGLVNFPYTLTAFGTLASSQLEGGVTYSTPTTFRGENFNDPHEGEFLIVSEGSSALLIAQPNAVDVVIELYSNTTATGEPDDTIMTTWAELVGM